MVETVEQYLASIPAETRVALEQLRKTIKDLAQGATDTVSYRIPVVKYQGRSLVGFGARGKNCSFYLMSSAMIPKLARLRDTELKGYDVTGATVHFTPDKPLPSTIVRKLVRERITENTLQAKNK